MKIYKKENTYYIDYHGQEFKLFLLTSVADFNGRMFQKAIRWKVQDDKDFLKQLLKSAAQNPCKETFEALIEMENHYRELKGVPSEGTDKSRSSEIKQARCDAEKDLFSIGNQKVSVTSIKGELVEAIQLLEEQGQLCLSIGEAVDLKRKADGVARNKYRKQKK